jgi:hypothetical protein
MSIKQVLEAGLADYLVRSDGKNVAGATTKGELIEGLDRYASWMTSLRFRVESPALQVGGVYDSYEFVIDENGKVRSVSAIKSAS